MNQTEQNVQTTTEFAAADCKKTISKLTLSLACAYLLTVFVSEGLQLLAAKGMENGTITLDKTTVLTVLGFIPVYLICFPLFLLLTRKIPSVAPERSKLGAKRMFTLVMMVFPIMVAGNIIGNILSAVLSGGKSSNTVVELVSGLNPMGVVVGTLLGPVFEELIFRKWLIDHTLRFGEKYAIFFSALFFGMFHMNLYQIFYAFGIGLILGYIYVRTGNVLSTMLIHIGINSLSTIVVPILMQQSEYYTFLDMIQNQQMDMEFLNAHIVWIGLLMLYSCLFFIAIIIGIAMLIVNQKQLEIHQREGEIPFGRGVRATFTSGGMIFFTVMTVILILLKVLLPLFTT